MNIIDFLLIHQRSQGTGPELLVTPYETHTKQLIFQQLFFTQSQQFLIFQPNKKIEKLCMFIYRIYQVVLVKGTQLTY